MSDDHPSTVHEAVPALYVVPQRIDEEPSLTKKLEARGTAALSTTELVAMVLGSHGAQAARTLVKQHGVSGLDKLDLVELRTVPRIGKVAAARLAASLELARRMGRENRRERCKLSRPADVYREVADLRRARKEHLVGLFLDAQNGLLHRETISIGSLNTTRTHPREILFPAILHAALGFILAHNHPSGCLDPSPEDIEFTAAVKRAGELVGIELYDHLIVAGSGYTSLRERGLL